MKKTFYLTSAITTKKASSKKGLQIAGYANTADKDRQGDTVLPSAWVKGLDNYRINPILLFQHKADQPIGKVSNIRVDPKGLFVEATISDAAEEQYNIQTLVKDDVLKSFSVGFRIRDQKYDSETDSSTITDLELLEISVVSIPANQTSLFSVRKSFDSEEEYKKYCEEYSQKEDEVTKDITAGISSFEDGHYHSLELDENKNGRTVYTSHGETSHTHEIVDNQFQETDGHNHIVRVIDLVQEDEEEEENLTVDQSEELLHINFENNTETVVAVEKSEEVTIEGDETLEEEKEELENEDAEKSPYNPIPFENCLCAETSKIKHGDYVKYKGKRWVVNKIATFENPSFIFGEIDINNGSKDKSLTVKATELSILNDWDLDSGYDIQLLDQDISLELNDDSRSLIKDKFAELVNLSAKEIYDLKTHDQIINNKSYQEKLNRLLTLKLTSTNEWNDTNFVVANHICEVIQELKNNNLMALDDGDSEYNFALKLNGHKIEISKEENNDMATQLVGDTQVVDTKKDDSQPENTAPRVEVSEPRVAELIEKTGDAIMTESDSGINEKSSEQVSKELEEVRSLKADLSKQIEEVSAYTKSKMEFHENSRRGENQFSEKEMADAYFYAKAMGLPDNERLFETKLGSRMKAVTTVDQFLSNFSKTVQEELEQELIIVPMLDRVQVDARNFRVPVSDEDTDLNVAQFPSGTFALGVDDTTNVAVSVQNTISAVTFTPHKFMSATHLAKDEEEDTVLPLIGFLRAGAARRMARSIDKSLLRGDGSLTSGAATQAPSDYVSVINGMVNRAEAVGADGLKVFTGANATQASAVDIASARAKMGKYGINVNANDLMYITSIEGYNELVQTPDFRTIDTFGPQATYKTGVIGSIWGIPVVISEFMDNKGPTTASNNSVGVMIYKPGFLVAERRGVMVETEYEPRQQVTAVYMSTRLDMQALTTVASAALSNSYSMAVSIQTGDGTI